MQGDTDASDAGEIGDVGDAARALWRYWHNLPRPGHVPSRHDFDPMALAQHLPFVSMTDRLGPGQWRIRVMGTAMVERVGADLTGHNFLDLFDPAHRDTEDRRLALLLTHPCGTVTARGGMLANGLTRQDRTLALPLRDGDGRIRLIVAASDPTDTDTRKIDSRLTGLQVLDRRYLDIGAGVPAMPA